MILIAILTFLGIFVVATLLLSAAGSGRAKARKRATTRLESLMADFMPVSEDLPNLLRDNAFSSIPLLNRWLNSMEIAPKLRDLLSQAEVKWSPSRLVLLSAACALIPGYLVYLRTNVFLISALAGCVFGAAPFWYVLFMRQKRFSRFEQGLPAALELMVSGLRSGHSLISALNLVSRETPEPIGPEFRICFEEQNFGLELRTALENLAHRVPIQDVRLILTAILIQKETGGNLAELLEKCAHVIRERFRLKKEIQIRTAQGRLTGLILTLLPVILAFLMYLINPKHVSLLWTRPMGLKMLYASILMTCIGGVLIRRIVSIRV